jgi:hypothetical protein
MFWGEGDTSKLTASERKALEELRRLAETGHIVGLSPEPTTIALAAIRVYGSISATYGLLAGIRNTAVMVGALLAIWWACKDAIIQFIQSAAGGG